MCSTPHNAPARSIAPVRRHLATLQRAGTPRRRQRRQQHHAREDCQQCRRGTCSRQKALSCSCPGAQVFKHQAKVLIPARSAKCCAQYAQVMTTSCESRSVQATAFSRPCKHTGSATAPGLPHHTHTPAAVFSFLRAGWLAAGGEDAGRLAPALPPAAARCGCGAGAGRCGFSFWIGICVVSTPRLCLCLEHDVCQPEQG